MRIRHNDDGITGTIKDSEKLYLYTPSTTTLNDRKPVNYPYKI
jgi:hypothetical protein